MEITSTEYEAILDREEAELLEKRRLRDEALLLQKEIADLLPKELREEHEKESESVKTAWIYLDEAKTAFGVAREKQKVIEKKIADILNGEQLKLYLGGTSKPAGSVGGIGRGKQGKRILELAGDGLMKRTDMVSLLKSEFNGSDCHGAFDSLKKSGKINITDGMVELV